MIRILSFTCLLVFIVIFQIDGFLTSRKLACDFITAGKCENRRAECKAAEEETSHEYNLVNLECNFSGVPATILAFEEDFKWAQRIKEFNECTGAELGVIYTDTENEMAEALITDVNKNNIYDAYVLELPWAIPVEEKLLNLNEYIASGSVDWLDINLASRRSVAFDGKTRALPLDTDYISIGYRLDVFEKYNLTAPNTIEEMAEQSEFLYGKDHNDDGEPDWGFCMSGQANYFLAFVATVFQRVQYTSAEDGVNIDFEECYKESDKCVKTPNNMFFDVETFELMMGDNEAFAYVVRIYERILRTSNCAAQVLRGEKCDRREAFPTGRCAAVISLPGTMSKMILPPEAGGKVSPRRYSDTPPDAIKIENKTDFYRDEIVWTPSNKSGHWGRRHRFPGSRKVWNEKTRSLESCNEQLCPHGEKIDGTIVNFVPFFAEGGEVYTIRGNTPENKARVLWAFFAWLSRLNPGKLPIAGEYRRSHLDPSHELGNEYWPEVCKNDLRTLLTQVFETNNAASDLLIKGYQDYMESLEDLLHKEYLTNVTYLKKNLSEITDSEWNANFRNFAQKLTSSWKQVTEDNGGALVQLQRWRNALGLEQLSSKDICALYSKDEGSYEGDLVSKCVKDANIICPPEEYNISVSECTFENRRVIDYKTSNVCNTFKPVADGAPTNIACSYVPFDSRYGVSIIVVAVVGALLNSVVLIILIMNWEHPFVRATQVHITSAFVVSAIFCCLSTMSLIGQNTNATCSLRYWFPVLPATLCLALLFMKVYRVYKIFDSARLLKKSKGLSDVEFIKYVSFVVGIQFLLLIIVSTVSKPEATVAPIDEPMDTRYCGVSCEQPVETVCSVDSEYLILISYAYMFVIIFLGCVLSFQARHLPDLFCEAKYIMMAMYNILFIVLMIAGVVAIFVFGQKNTSGEHELILTIGYVLAPTNAVMIILLPKIVNMKFLSLDEAREQVEKQLIESTGGKRGVRVHYTSGSKGFSTTAPATTSQINSASHSNSSSNNSLGSFAEISRKSDKKVTLLQSRISTLEAELNELKTMKQKNDDGLSINGSSSNDDGSKRDTNENTNQEQSLTTV